MKDRFAKIGSHNWTRRATLEARNSRELVPKPDREISSVEEVRAAGANLRRRINVYFWSRQITRPGCVQTEDNVNKDLNARPNRSTAAIQPRRIHVRFAYYRRRDKGGEIPQAAPYFSLNVKRGTVCPVNVDRQLARGIGRI